MSRFQRVVLVPSALFLSGLVLIGLGTKLDVTFLEEDHQRMLGSTLGLMGVLWFSLCKR
ncbi:hypothetical protein VK792_11295 [Mesobacterium sp. TK19101]|uniref:Uncharacterized protein n=1 Tax=Mesobacterium hydrothermale TaxID=3111907 RepID=A0ABU6HHM8_9RHOB|nr:hypothetical protein [Mesobacterium sp. TK19101]MEC3861871.1 hypothetical protein [Mesobacterium sp. TK19101]